MISPYTPTSHTCGTYFRVLSLSMCDLNNFNQNVSVCRIIRPDRTEVCLHQGDTTTRSVLPVGDKKRPQRKIVDSKQPNPNGADINIMLTKPFFQQ